MWRSREPGQAASVLPPTRVSAKFRLFPSESLKTAADRLAEKQVLRKLLDVVNQRDALIRLQEEHRLRELASGPGAQG